MRALVVPHEARKKQKTTTTPERSEIFLFAKMNLQKYWAMLFKSAAGYLYI